MATLELRYKTCRVVFRYAGRKYAYSLGTGAPGMTEALRGGVEKTLMLLGQGLIGLPPDTGTVTFLRHDGKPPRNEEAVAGGRPVTLAQLRDRYLQTHGNGATEATPLATVRMHLAHFERIDGPRFPVGTPTLADLQRHVNGRRKKQARGRALGPVHASARGGPPAQPPPLVPPPLLDARCYFTANFATSSGASARS